MDRQTFRRILLKSAFRKRKMYENLLDNVPMLKTLQVIFHIIYMYKHTQESLVVVAIVGLLSEVFFDQFLLKIPFRLDFAPQNIEPSVRYGIRSLICFYRFYSETKAPFIQTCSSIRRNAFNWKKSKKNFTQYLDKKKILLRFSFGLAVFLFNQKNIFPSFSFSFQSYEKMNLADALQPKTYAKGERIIKQGKLDLRANTERISFRAKIPQTRKSFPVPVFSLAISFALSGSFGSTIILNTHKKNKMLFVHFRNIYK